MKLTKLDQIQRSRIQTAASHLRAQSHPFRRGEGVHLIDEQGDRYLDLLSGIGVNALGYATRRSKKRSQRRAAR